MTWEAFEREIEELAKIINSPVDIIVPIARGGLIPGRLLATKLHVKTMYAVTVIKSKEKNIVVTEINENYMAKVFFSMAQTK